MISRWKIICVTAGLSLVIGCLDVGSGLPSVPRTGDMAPEFQAKSMDTGQAISLEDFRGQPVLVNLWATWCIPCRVETPFLQETYLKHKDQGLRILGISVDSPGSEDIIKTFLEDNSDLFMDIQLFDDRLTKISDDSSFASGNPALNIR